MRSEAQMVSSIRSRSLILLSVFELRYQTKQISFWILATAMLAYGVLITVDHLGEGMSQLQSNSPYRLSYFIALTSCLSVIVISFLCMHAFLRDSESRFCHLVGYLNNPKQRQAQLLVVMVLAIAMLSLLTIGMALGLFSPNLVHHIGVEKIADFSFSNYLKPWLIFVMPNCIIISLILSAICIRFQKSFLVYAVALILFMLFAVSIIIIGAPITGTPVSARESTLIIAALLDPFAAAAFFEQTALMSVETKNHQNTQLTAWLLANRVLWLCAATFIFVICRNKQPMVARRKVHIIHENVKTKKNKITSEYNYQHSSVSHGLIAPKKHSIFNDMHFNSHFEVKCLLNDQAFQAAMLLWVAMILVGISMVDHTFIQAEMVDQFASTSHLISQCAEAFSGLALFFVIYFCADKLWRANTVKMTGIIETTPVTNLTLDSAKLLSLFIIPSIMLLALIAVAVFYQLLNTATLVDLSTYFSMFMYLVLPVCIKTCTVFLIQAAVLHSRIANKYLAMLLSALVVFGLPIVLTSLGVENPLLVFNHIPEVIRSYSEFDGYGLVGESAKWLTLYWGLIAVVVARFAFSLNRRNAQPSALVASKKILLNTSVFIGILITAWAIQNNLPNTQHNKSAHAQLDSFQDYELLYKDYQSIIHPQVVHTDSVIEHDPSNYAIQVKASSTIKNNSAESIQRIFLTSMRPMFAPKIVGAKLIHQKSSGYWHVFVYEFTHPMQQGDVRELSYSMKVQSTPFDIKGNIKANGTYLHQGQIEPVLGYVSAIEIQDDFQRKKRDMPLLADSKVQLSQQTNTVRRTFKTRLVTASDMIAITVGKLANQGIENGRDFYQYEMNQAVFPMVSYFFGRYQKQDFSYAGIPIEIYYDQKHRANVAEMARAAKLTIGYMQAEFGSYAYDSLRLIETTRTAPFGGRASAGVVALNESLFVQNPKGKVKINNVARNTIHEVVHQWFGEKLAAKDGPGQKVIHESITKYLEAEILAIAESPRMADELMAYNHRRYLSGRSYAHKKEVPLSESQNESYLFYGKGPVVFKAIQKQIGQEKLHSTLRALIENHRNNTNLTFEHMLAAILKNTPDNKKPLVKSWLTQVVEVDNDFMKKLK